MPGKRGHWRRDKRGWVMDDGNWVLARTQYHCSLAPLGRNRWFYTLKVPGNLGGHHPRVLCTHQATIGEAIAAADAAFDEMTLATLGGQYLDREGDMRPGRGSNFSVVRMIAVTLNDYRPPVASERYRFPSFARHAFNPTVPGSPFCRECGRGELRTH